MLANLVVITCAWLLNPYDRRQEFWDELDKFAEHQGQFRAMLVVGLILLYFPIPILLYALIMGPPDE